MYISMKVMNIDAVSCDKPRYLPFLTFPTVDAISLSLELDEIAVFDVMSMVRWYS